MSAELLADLLVNGIALVAVLLTITSLAGAPNAVARRLRRLLTGLAILLGLRMINWVQPSLLLAIPVTIVAAWLPLTALRLAEELVRRHASGLLKRAALAGAIAFSGVALVTGAFFPREVMAALALFQAGMLLWIGAFLLGARTRQLAPAETSLADTFAFALLLAIPFAISDFRGTLPALPVRLGAIGVMLFVLTSLRLWSGTGSPRPLLTELLGLIACGAAVAGGAALLVPALLSSDLWRLGALAASAAAALQIMQRLGDVGRADLQRSSLLPALQQLPDGAECDALVAAHPLTASGTVIDPAGLDLYDSEAVAALANRRVITASTDRDGQADQAAANLMAEHGATHLVRLSRVPPRFLAVNAGRIAGSGPLDLELDMLARLADRSDR